MSKLFKIPLVLEPQKEGGWTVTSPILPELITEVDDLQQMDEVVRDAMNAVIELYEDTGKEFPAGQVQGKGQWFRIGGIKILNKVQSGVF